MDMTGRAFGQRTVATHLENAINTAIGQVIQDPNQLDFFAKQYDAVIVPGKRPYAMFPVPVIQFKDIAKGVRRIYAKDSNALVFVPIPGFGHQLFSQVGLDQIDDSIGYEVKTDRVMLFNLRYPIENIVMELVKPFSHWSDDEEYPIPAGTANFITQMAVDSLTGKDSYDNIHKARKSQ